MANATLLGTVIFANQGDRQLQYLDPKTYEDTPSSLTALGAQQSYQLGQHIVDTYATTRSPTWIQGLVLDPFVPVQNIVRADAGDDAGVVYGSTVALSQAIWKPSARFNIRLANGSTITGPMNGYQYIQVQSVSPSQDVSLDGWSSCTKFEDTIAKFHASDAFKSKKEDSQSWFSQLGPYLDGRPATLENMYNVWDYMNTRYTHNVTYAASLPDGWMGYARSLADWHEYNVFGGSSMNDIANVAGRTVLASLLQDLQRIASLSDPLRLVVNGVSYQPFISLFNMFGVQEKAPELAGMVNYGGALAFEVWKSSGTSDATIRMRFKNGSSDVDFARYPWLGTDGDIPLSQLLQKTESAAIGSMAAWCGACGNNVDRGCAALAGAAHTSGHGLSRAASGAIGAVCALALAGAIIALLAFFGLARFGRSRVERRRSQGSTFNRKNSRDEDAFPLGVKGSMDRNSITKVPVAV